MRVKWTTETFIQKLMSIFGNDYVYDFTEYHGAHERVLIYCKKHGFFRSYASDLIRGHGCRKCSQAKSGLSRKDSFDDVVGKIKQRHGDKYIIPQQVYTNDRTKMRLICPIHGEFESKPMDLKQGCGCPKCGRESAKKKNTMTNEEFKEKFLKTYGYEKYDLSKTDLENKDENGKVIFVCHKKFKDGREHGKFLMTPNNMLSLHGCPHCKQSRLEHEITTLLARHNIQFMPQCNKKTFQWLNGQSLDFYLPQYNIAIECQGGGHFFPIRQFGGEEAFKKRIKMDELKQKLCFENNIKLLYYTNIRKYIDNITIFDKDNIIKIIQEHGKAENRNK